MSYVIISRSTEAETDATPHRAERIQWMKGLQQQGIVILSGPSVDRTTSVFVIEAADAQAARQTMESDPYQVHGIRQNELIEWEIHYRAPITAQ